jgi:predicted metal-binding protein
MKPKELAKTHTAWPVERRCFFARFSMVNCLRFLKKNKYNLKIEQKGDGNVVRRAQLEKIFQDHNFLDFRWIKPHDIVVSQWVRMKCTFGCTTYGKKGSCPPNTPSVTECREFFSEYSQVVVFRVQAQMKDPEKRSEWSAGVNSDLLRVEREVFLCGFPKAFLLFLDECCLCKECPGTRGDCKNLKDSRPCPESLAMDVFATVRSCGYPIEVLTDYRQVMNRYSFLLID